MDCIICDKPINLIPSAGDRAAKFGGKPADFVRLFTTHADCAIAKRNQDTSNLTLERSRNVVKLHSSSGDQSTLDPLDPKSKAEVSG